MIYNKSIKWLFNTLQVVKILVLSLFCGYFPSKFVSCDKATQLGFKKTTTGKQKMCLCCACAIDWVRERARDKHFSVVHVGTRNEQQTLGLGTVTKVTIPKALLWKCHEWEHLAAMECNILVRALRKPKPLIVMEVQMHLYIYIFTLSTSKNETTC